jgi:hypothetical protein
MPKKKKFTVLSGDSDIVARMTRLKILLAEAGYKIFDVVKEKQLTDLDVMVIDTRLNFDVSWVYPTRKGWLVVRPLVGSHNSLRLKKSVNSPRAKVGRRKTISSELRLMRSRTVPPGNMWSDWISPESKQEATILRLPV